jgi:single-strand DNA-binding protein
MGRSLNQVHLIGRLGKDAELSHTQGGTAVTKFSLATDRRWKDASGEWKEETDWHELVQWKAENVAPYLVKGAQVYVEGRLQTRSWEGSDGVKRFRTEVIVSNLILLGGKGEGRGEGKSGAAKPSAEDSLGITDDDCPF